MIYFYGHLGLGDMLLTNAIVRHLSALHDRVLIACWPQYETSVRFMYRDLENIDIKIVHTEHEARSFEWEHKTLKLGWGGDHGNFNHRIFDQEFYRQAGLPMDDRWDKFKFVYDASIQLWYDAPFRFVHDDVERGFIIDRLEFSKGCPTVRPMQKPNIFQFIWMLTNAEEIHCINSSFLILADSIPTLAKRLVLHRYARPTDHPKLRKNWEIIS